MRQFTFYFVEFLDLLTGLARYLNLFANLFDYFLNHRIPFILVFFFNNFWYLRAHFETCLFQGFLQLFYYCIECLSFAFLCLRLLLIYQVVNIGVTWLNRSVIVYFIRKPRKNLSGKVRLERFIQIKSYILEPIINWCQLLHLRLWFILFMKLFI